MKLSSKKLNALVIKRIDGIPISVNKFSEYCLRNGELARKQERLLANRAEAEEIRRWLRRIIQNFEIKHGVKLDAMPDNKIIPWIKSFYDYKEPVRIELIIVLLHVKLCVEFSIFDSEFGNKMAKSNELRCLATLGQ